MSEIRKQKPIAEFQVQGISCLDCAQKFEQAVRQLPGVVQAALNPLSGKLSVTGTADLAAIRRLGSEEGYAAALLYAICYALMSAGSFAAIILLSRKGFEAEEISDYSGLFRTHPWFALMILLLMASLAGIPPLFGFWAKLAVLRATIEGGMLWLAIVGIVFAVIGCFYYLRVVKVMYFDEPVGAPLPAHNDRVLGIVLGVNSLALLVLPLGLNPILEWCQRAFM